MRTNTMAIIEADKKHIVKCMGSENKFVEKTDEFRTRNRLSERGAIGRMVWLGLFAKNGDEMYNHITKSGIVLISSTHFYPKMGVEARSILPTVVEGVSCFTVQDVYAQLIIRDGTKLYNEIKTKNQKTNRRE